MAADSLHRYGRVRVVRVHAAIAELPSCGFLMQVWKDNVAVAGELEVWTLSGERTRIRAGDSYTIPPGHDAKVVGDQPFAGIEWSSAATYAKD